jgi:D-glycero-alpha-D-manno-heptose 1-phosphate guanylyltransferase
MEAIVLAGGLGTRLRSVLPDTPQVLAPVLGKPWLKWVLEYLSHVGFVHVCLATGYKGNDVAAEIGEFIQTDGRRMRVTYSHETEPLGTGGALLKAQAQFNRSALFALNGDTLVTLAWREMLAGHEASQQLLSIATRQVPDRSRYGAVDVAEGRVVTLGEKNRKGEGLVNAGVYTLSAQLFASSTPPSRSFSFETEFVEPNLQTLKPKAYVTTAPFIDIGVPEDYARAADFVRRNLLS